MHIHPAPTDQTSAKLQQELVQLTEEKKKRKEKEEDEKKKNNASTTKYSQHFELSSNSKPHLLAQKTHLVLTNPSGVLILISVFPRVTGRSGHLHHCIGLPGGDHAVLAKLFRGELSGPRKLVGTPKKNRGNGCGSKLERARANRSWAVLRSSGKSLTFSGVNGHTH